MERTERKTDQEILDEIEEGFRLAIHNGDLSVATIDPVERAYSEDGEYMGAFVTMYAFVDDSDEEEVPPAEEFRERAAEQQQAIDDERNAHDGTATKPIAW